MQNEEQAHVGQVVEILGSGLVRVRLDLSHEDCGACALSAVCSPDTSKKTEITVMAAVGDNLSLPSTGSKVVLKARSGGTLRASLLLLVIPLAVFVLAAVAGTILDLGQGLTGVVALVAAFITYPVIRWCHRPSQKPMWNIVFVQTKTAV